MSGRLPYESERFDVVGLEWEEAESRAREMGVDIVRLPLVPDNDDGAPQRVIRQRERDGRIELVTAPEVWAL